MNQNDILAICEGTWNKLPPAKMQRIALLGLASMLRAFTDGTLRVADDVPRAEAFRAGMQFFVFATVVDACTKDAPFSDRETALMTAWRQSVGEIPSDQAVH